MTTDIRFENGLPVLQRPVGRVDDAVQATRLLRAIEKNGREDLGQTIAGAGRGALRRRGIDPDSGLTYAELRDRQLQLKAEAAARRAARA